MKISKFFVVGIICLILVGWANSDLKNGKEAFQKHEFNKAIELFTKVIKSNPKEQEAYFFRGATFSAVGKFNEAIEDYTKVIELNPKNKEAYWSRGYCYQNMRMDDKAIVDYTKSLKLGTKFKGMVYELRGGAYFRKGMFDEAESDFKAALEVDSGSARALGGLEEIRKAKSDPNYKMPVPRSKPIEEMPMYGGVPPTPEIQKINEKFIKQAIADHGSREAAFEAGLFYAKSYIKKGDLATAMKRLNQAWLLDPNRSEVFSGFGWVLGLQKDYQGAIEMYTKAIELKPSFEDAYFNRAQNYLKLKKYDEAITDFTKTISINPKAADAYNGRGYVYYLAYQGEDDTDKALADFAKAIELDPKNPMAYYNRANIYFMNKEYDKIWADILTMKSLSIPIDPQLIDRLKKVSSKEK